MIILTLGASFTFFDLWRCSKFVVCAQAYELRGAGAVLHSHSLNAVLATLIDETAKEFKVTHLEMIKVWLAVCITEYLYSMDARAEKRVRLGVHIDAFWTCETGHCWPWVLQQLCGPNH